MKKLLKNLQDLDRRWVYLFIAIAIIMPLVFPFNSDTYTSQVVENIYQLIDSYSPYVRADDLNNDGIISEAEVEEFIKSGKQDRSMLFDIYHDASTNAELFPMEIALMRHCFYRRVPFYVWTIIPAAAPIIEQALSQATEGVEKSDLFQEQNRHIVRGRDYCNIGYKPGELYLPIILGMGDDIARAVETDADGKRIENLPIYKNTAIKNYSQMNLVYETSGSDTGFSWMLFVRPQFGVNVAVGLTAVMAADQYPYIQSGQCIGMTAGLKGAAEYEMLVDMFAMRNRTYSKGQINHIYDEYKNKKDESERLSILKDLDITNDAVPSTFKAARLGMNAQTVAHIIIIIFIILGNIGYFMSKKKNKKN